MSIITDNAKAFHNPDTGTFLGTIIDVVDLGKVHTQFGDKNKIRIIWVLDKMDPDGSPFRVMRQVTASMNEKAALYELVKGILGTAPPVPFDDETLIGRSNQLVVVKEADPKTGKVFANVKVVLPLPAGTIAPQAPQGFVRSKNRTPNQTATSAVSAVAGQAQVVTANPTQTAQATPAAQPAVAPVTTVDAAF